MKTIILDGSRVQSEQDFHTQLAQALSFPYWYGQNLDALYDCLTDLPEESMLSLENWTDLEARLGSQAGKFLRVLQDADADSHHFHLQVK